MGRRIIKGKKKIFFWYLSTCSFYSGSSCSNFGIQLNVTDKGYQKWIILLFFFTNEWWYCFSEDQPPCMKADKNNTLGNASIYLEIQIGNQNGSFCLFVFVFFNSHWLFVNWAVICNFRIKWKSKWNKYAMEINIQQRFYRNRRNC